MAKRRPIQEAVALAYREGAAAPRVVAKGRGLMAETIIERARDAGVYVHESPELVTLLMQVDLDRHIPPELYRAVAELLAFIHFIERGVDEAIAPPDLGLLLPATNTAPAQRPVSDASPSR
ncbi:EscU/YscU/HrcU family type III secretion system export apparatus switch protein [Chitinimonas sp. BJYL2]|uniref:EscU/YscU/HrcU family type III secretion system export apparatus switch protein n=1 Tax=Chitinimonas sp. BJYL2 TaxID=2976696 RepID=UPI0022B481D1|nr:EscU/YscU/HrcU family type III secretion system export apparatus switch protein [Chitinimonas sp. BJYL2]